MNLPAIPYVSGDWGGGGSGSCLVHLPLPAHRARLLAGMITVFGHIHTYPVLAASLATSDLQTPPAHPDRCCPCGIARNNFPAHLYSRGLPLVRSPSALSALSATPITELDFAASEMKKRKRKRRKRKRKKGKRIYKILHGNQPAHPSQPSQPRSLFIPPGSGYCRAKWLGAWTPLTPQ